MKRYFVAYEDLQKERQTIKRTTELVGPELKSITNRFPSLPQAREAINAALKDEKLADMYLRVREVDDHVKALILHISDMYIPEYKPPEEEELEAIREQTQNVLLKHYQVPLRVSAIILSNLEKAIHSYCGHEGERGAGGGQKLS